ncbi:MAG: hypothetical protein V5A45_02785 [Haloarculaceae archaeon]
MSLVAERALLASERADGSYAVATSRWGGTDQMLAAVCAGIPPSALPTLSWNAQRDRPDFLSVVATLDVLSTELLYRVANGETTPFLSLWFGLPLASTTARPTVGALVAVESLADARAIRRWFRSLKGNLADEVTAGTLSPSVVPLILVAAVIHLSGRERYLLPFPGTAEPLSTNTGPDGP